MSKRLYIVIIALCISLFCAACGKTAGPVARSEEEISMNAQSEDSDVYVPDSSEIISEPEISAPAEPEPAETPATIYNVRDYGAKGNGDADDTAAFQAALDDAAKNGGTVWVPAGRYNITKTLFKKSKVSLKGEGMWVSTLVWAGAKNGVLLDISNASLWGTTIEDLFFTNGMMNGVTAILGGSTLKNYNSAIGTFKNLVFFKFDTAIRGNAEPEGVGIFDCYFENVFCSDCGTGLHLFGSGNTVVHPRIATCEVGISLDFLNGESFDGMHIIGGIFASNGTDISIPSSNGIRPTDFVGTWFENASKGILNIANPNTRVMNLTFRDCMLNSAADNVNYYLFDARNANGTVTVDACTVVENRGIMPPTSASSTFRINGLQVYDSTGVYAINSTEGGKCDFSAGKTERKVSHKLGVVPKYVTVTPASKDAAECKYFVTADDRYIIITLTERPESGDISFYWEANR